MSIYVNNQYRIKRSASQQDIMIKLTQAGIFDSYKDILMISAIIGFNNNQYIPIQKTASDGVLMQFFSSIDYDIIDLIAYAHKKDQSILITNEKYDIFSCYANGGFPILLEKLEIYVEDDLTNIDISSRDKLKKYYRLVLTNGFNISNEDISNQLFI